MKSRKIIIFFLIVVFVVFIFSVIFSILNMNNPNILYGISINGIDISGLSKEEATNKINNLIDEKFNNSILIFCPKDNTNVVSLESLGINYNVSAAIADAYNIGRAGNIFKNNFEILDIIINKKNINLNIDINEKNLNNLLNDLSSNLPDRLINSNYYIEDNNLIITNGQDGNVVDNESFTVKLKEILSDLTSKENSIELPIKKANYNQIDIEQIYNEIYKEPQNAYYEQDPLKIYPEVTGVLFDKEYAKNLLNTYQEEYSIPLIITNPEITINNLGIDIFQYQIATFTTKYDVKNTDRSVNLELAASKINETIIPSGEEFSYNKTVGARTIAAGYKEAKVYENGQIVDGLGGGICQISSTLYNTVMFANLEVTQRYNHQFTTSYVQAGRDATVAYGSKDLKFKNTRSYPIKIKASVSDGIVRISIYGIKQEPEYDISFDLETVSTTNYSTQYKEDDSLALNTQRIEQQGINGIVVNSYKVTKLNGAIISRDLISTDTYNAINEIIVKGTKSN